MKAALREKQDESSVNVCLPMRSIFCVHGQTLVCAAVAYRGEKRSRLSIHVR